LYALGKTSHIVAEQAEIGGRSIQVQVFIDAWVLSTLAMVVHNTLAQVVLII
jgi:hypothetical protein